MSSEFCTVQVVVGLKNLHVLKSGDSPFQWFDCTPFHSGSNKVSAILDFSGVSVEFH